MVTRHLQQSVAGGSRQHVTVAALQQAGNITRCDIAVKVVGGDVLKAFSVVGLECSIHAYIENALTILGDAVDIVAGHAQILHLLFFQDNRLIAIEAV